MTTRHRDDVRPEITVVICTFNRATLLNKALDSLARVRIPAGLPWEAIVVDNNSTDTTPNVVRECAASFPVPLRYVLETTPGKSTAMNAGLRAAASSIIAFIDDDVTVAEEWLAGGCAPLLDESSGIAYTGGPVDPEWEQPCPTWFPNESCDLWGTIAILDYGVEPFVFEERQRVPLGANFAIRRQLIDRIGGFLPQLGRAQSGTILGQELPEFFRRAHRVGARGLYVPAMRVRHHVPAARMTPAYFRRWWFGKGVSRARVDRLHPLTELGIDLRAVPHVARVPRFMYGSLLRDAAAWAGAVATRQRSRRLVCETRAAYFTGYFWERQRERWQAADRPRVAAAPPVLG